LGVYEEAAKPLRTGVVVMWVFEGRKYVNEGMWTSVEI
jgi:hypothetical protein